MRWFNDLQCNTASPENAVRIRLVSDYMDVRKLLSQVKAPTLVLHCRDAAGIPGARFVRLEGQNHLILETDPGWSKFQEEIKAFLAA